jgi:hypothetical protein
MKSGNSIRKDGSGALDGCDGKKNQKLARVCGTVCYRPTPSKPRLAPPTMRPSPTKVLRDDFLS